MPRWNLSLAHELVIADVIQGSAVVFSFARTGSVAAAFHPSATAEPLSDEMLVEQIACGKQLAMRSHFVRITGKIDEQLKFLWRQLQFAATDGNRVRVQVNAEITIFDHSSTTFFLRSTS